jgi:2-polyprenyl-3-methyl-5-hydroxy-6-metoxy-1,4-benzoquinol methylase
VKVLLVPAVARGAGSGHLRRARYLARIFGPDSALLIEEGASVPGPGGDRPAGDQDSGPGIVRRYDPADGWELVIVDRKSSTLKDIARFLPTPVVGIDEGGPSRRYLSYLVDVLPGIRRGRASNLSALGLLDLPERQASLRFPFRRLLLSFGGEDPADLSGRLLAVLLKRGLLPPQQITAVQGPYFARSSWPEGIEVLRSPEELKSVLPRYDLVLTSYGLTSFEALAAGVPVINLNPSFYHRRLSRAAGIPEIGVRRPKTGKLVRLLASRESFERLLARYPADRFKAGPGAEELPRRLHPAAPACCPVCRETRNRALARFDGRSYFRCRGCGLLYMLGFGGVRKSYNRDYFFRDYRRQYGRSYLEDFESIKATGTRRLQVIRGLLGRSSRPADAALRSPELLDVGCAYGPFLQAAREQGFAVQGLDISPEAVRYVRDTLDIPCQAGDFSALADASARSGSPAAAGGAVWTGDPAPREPLPLTGQAGTPRFEVPGFDVLTMWYVIEHFRNTAAVLRLANLLLKPGGILAFSTPSASGVSARRNRRSFLESSPADHFTVWPLRSAAGVLDRFGFRLRRVVVTGHHGERFPWSGRLSPDSPAAAVLAGLSRLLRLGDTFEAYAEKVRELPEPSKGPARRPARMAESRRGPSETPGEKRGPAGGPS